MLQTVSCFRSTGSMPVPRPVSLIIPHYLPHRDSKKRRSLEEPPEPRLELVLRHATLLTLDPAQLHTAGDTADSGEVAACEARARTQEEPRLESVIKPATVKIINPPPPPEPEPAPEPPKREQKCKKHSRCHCDLLSLETTDFFTIKV